MPICKVCGKEIPYGKSYKGEHFKNEKFCSAECYTERLNASTKLNPPAQKPKINYKPPKKSDRRKVTDYIQDWWPYEPNWAFLMTQLKAIMDEYELSYIDVLLILKYCREYEQIELDPTYGLYQFFPKYIEPTRQFIEDIDNAKDEAKDLFNPTPILAKKYRPKRKFKFDLTFD